MEATKEFVDGLNKKHAGKIYELRKPMEIRATITASGNVADFSPKLNCVVPIGTCITINRIGGLNDKIYPHFYLTNLPFMSNFGKGYQVEFSFVEDLDADIAWELVFAETR